jgi:hypothetical protein
MRPENHSFIGRTYQAHVPELGGEVRITVLMFDGRRFFVQDAAGRRATMPLLKLERMVQRGLAQEVGRL